MTEEQQEIKKDLTIKKLKEKAWGLTDDVIASLRYAFRRSYTVQESCDYAGIDKATYYRWEKKSIEFATKMRSFKSFMNIESKDVLHDKIAKERSLETAKWHLERRQKRLYSPRTETTGAEGEPITGYEVVIIDKTSDIKSNDSTDPHNSTIQTDPTG